MKKQDKLTIFFQELQNNGVYMTEDFQKDIRNLVKSGVDTFVERAFRDLSRIVVDNQGKFKILSLTPKQKTQLDNNILMRYEYRNNLNLRCIFYIEKETITSIPILLCAFTEDGDKGKGLDSYNHNIDRAIQIYKSLK